MGPLHLLCGWLEAPAQRLEAGGAEEQGLVNPTPALLGHRSPAPFSRSPPPVSCSSPIATESRSGHRSLSDPLSPAVSMLSALSSPEVHHFSLSVSLNTAHIFAKSPLSGHDSYFYMSVWLGHRCPDLWSKLPLGVSVRMFLDEMDIWTHTEWSRVPP